MNPLRPPPAIPGVTRHAQERLADHYGIVASKAAWLEAVMSILDRRALLVRVQGTPGRDDLLSEVYALTLAGQAIEVVWKPSVGAVVTVLPRLSACGSTRRLLATRARMSPQERASRLFSARDYEDDA